ncbi:nicotinate phosphoribosyltransferase [Fistulifera solaris]|uniref:Nicotinate phosphoribosyltransferase n=1 Tax=Fistulifera solaris TaxID=1519565 RepID=A0A1Z5K6S5_FISSO|nr:nicotinate phosphoribosyltransferase [Fistulifera solaris]|eukprot:GAX21983.1 nicotinate phosphoribosyltransferase [Fistulifera solaris]
MASLQVDAPTNPLVSALLTDLYQITMAYAHWKNKRHNEPAIFELFFRKCPFGGEFAVFAGLDECIKHIAHFSFSESDIAYLRTSVPALSKCDAEFFVWLAQLDTSEVSVRALPEGTLCYGKLPLIIIEAPLAIGQLLETTLLTLVNYPTLLTTNAARMVRAAQRKQIHDTTLPPQCRKLPVCFEFGLRRAQGPDGGFSASKYALLGGFTGTSNVLAGKLCNVKIAGTHAHAFVQSYSCLEEVAHDTLLYPKVLQYRKQLRYETTNDGELAAFIAYGMAFPESFLCLVDTYDTLQSGLLNFILVALALDDAGYKPVGIRLDSGDLAFLSMECANKFAEFARERPFMNDLDILASNDINEHTLNQLNSKPHAITVYGIGTNLVTCQAQPALGGVYKLVEINKIPRIKFSQDIEKVLIPGRKRALRLWDKNNKPIIDVLLQWEEQEPKVGEKYLCRHPFDSRERVLVSPSRVELLHVPIFDKGRVLVTPQPLMEVSRRVELQLSAAPPEVLRADHPEPYKVFVSSQMYRFLHEMWEENAPITELS